MCEALFATCFSNTKMMSLVASDVTGIKDTQSIRLYNLQDDMPF
jgi:hypothetical protein